MTRPAQRDLQLGFAQLDAERYFAKRLAEHGHHEIFDGLTTSTDRKATIRAAILEAQLECAIIGRNKAGKPESYSDCFARCFGEPLVGRSMNPRKEKTACPP
jgi:hypothetical protein